MEPQNTALEDEDDSIPLGLRIMIHPIPGKPLEGICSISGLEPFTLPADLPSSEHLGQVMVTPAARALVKDGEILLALSYHLCEELKDDRPGRSCLSDPQTLQGCRVRGVYRGSLGAFWIITEADRRTTVLMPEEYKGREHC